MKKILFALFSLGFLGLGCSSSKITHTWKAENETIQQYKKVLVLGLIKEADRSIQENMENHLVSDLELLGYQAVSSLREFGPKAFDKMTEEKALEKLKNSAIDAVITIVLLDKEKESRYVPGNVFYSRYGIYHNRFWGYRASLYQRIYEPGYYVTDTKYFWESNVYDMSTQKLVYSVQTQSFDPANSESMAHEYGKLIVKSMVKENVLQDKKNAVPRAF